MTRITIVGLFAFAFLAITGCSKTILVKMEPQSHYTDPTTSVTPLGRVHGEATTYGIIPFTDPWADSELKLDAIKDAIAQKKGATLLINVAHTQTTTFYPSPIFLLFSVTKITYNVDGQAAKQEVIGK